MKMTRKTILEESMLTGLKRIVLPVVFLVSVVFGPTLPFVAGQATDKANQKWPATILIIRHAEKPPDESPSTELSPEGKERAKALHQLFEATDKRPNPFPRPDFIFAARNSKQSQRPVETVIPLAKELHLPVNADYSNEDFPKLAEEILRHSKYAGKTILICWHHGTIPELAHQLKASGTPNSWKGTAFNRVWQITFDEEGKTDFRVRPQKLLAKDLAK